MYFFYFYFRMPLTLRRDYMEKVGYVFNSIKQECQLIKDMSETDLRILRSHVMLNNVTNEP